MNILMLLTKPFRTDARVRREAETLAGAGHAVHVLEWSRHGQGTATEQDGVATVHRVTVRPTGAIRGVRAWWKDGAKAALQLIDSLDIHVIHAHDLDTLPLAARLRRHRDVRLVYDAHEHFGWMVQSTHGRFVAKAAELLERRHLRTPDAMITVNEALQDHYRRFRDVDLVRNCPTLTDAPAPPGDGPLHMVYVGNLAASRGWEWILDVMAEAPDAHLTVAATKEGLYDAVAQQADTMENITFLGTIPPDQVLAKTVQGNAILCMFDPADPNNRIGSPNKMYEAMMAGRPFIGSLGTHSGDAMAAHGAGIAVPYGPDGLRAAIEQLQEPETRRAMGARGRAMAETDHHWSADAEQLLSVYRRLEAP